MTHLAELVAEYRKLCDDWDHANNTGPLGSRGVPLPATAEQLAMSSQYAVQSFMRVAEKGAILYRIKRKELSNAIRGRE